VGEKLLFKDLADESFQLSTAEWVAQAVKSSAAHGLKVVFPSSNSGKTIVGMCRAVRSESSTRREMFHQAVAPRKAAERL
jgi:hypothetical protein